MPRIRAVVAHDAPLSIRSKQVSAMFDAPPSEHQQQQWDFDAPFDDKPWNVGLIVGPSGSGKSTIARHLWPDALHAPTWSASAIVDDFGDSLSLETIVGALGAVGFNTIPAWMRPHRVLSVGEQFRANMARALVDDHDPVVIDEFTSTVDRQVARIVAHAMQKSARKRGKRMVAVTCHDDVLPWLQPDWVIEPAERRFAWREVQRRPPIEVEVARVPFEAWSLFAPFHYLTATLNRTARCFGLWCNGTLASFAGVLARPHARVRNLVGVSRLVTLPDYQGLGLAMILVDALAAAYASTLRILHTYPAHPSLIRAFANSSRWEMRRAPGAGLNAMSMRRSETTAIGRNGDGWFGQRPCGTFRYIGERMRISDALALLDGA